MPAMLMVGVRCLRTSLSDAEYTSKQTDRLVPVCAPAAAPDFRGWCASSDELVSSWLGWQQEEQRAASVCR